MEKIIQTKVPEHLLKQADILIQQGWIADMDSLISEALRRYIESHRTEIMESYVRDDVEWGLHGKD
ncbi:MAG: CopG family transcriptional regulator [Vulcanimicrobiota bacterium]